NHAGRIETSDGQLRHTNCSRHLSRVCSDARLEDLARRLIRTSGAGFSLWNLVLARANIHRLKPAPPNTFARTLTSEKVRENWRPRSLFVSDELQFSAAASATNSQSHLYLAF